MKKSEKDLIHVMFEYDEAIQSKKEILSLEKDLIDTIKSIREYYSLRLLELDLKTKLERKIKELFLKIRNLQKTLPKLETKALESKEEKIKKIQSSISPKDDLEAQLEEIQRKLRLLGG